MAGQPVLPKGSPPPLAPCSPGFRSGRFVCTAGMLALDASGRVFQHWMPGEIEASENQPAA